MSVLSIIDIHKFHDGISRDLFEAYNARGVDDIYMISRALANGLIHKEEIPIEAIEIVERCAKTFLINSIFSGFPMNP